MEHMFDGCTKLTTLNKGDVIMKKYWILLAFVASVAMLLSCGNDLQGASEVSSDGGTYLVIGSASMARTVTPDKAETYLGKLTNLVLKGTRKSSDGETTDDEIMLAPSADSGKESLDKLEDLVGKPIPIQTGIWSFTLTAKLEGVDFSGTLSNKEIRAGETNTISFDLAASGAGGMSITVQFTNTNVSKVVATLKTAATDDAYGDPQEFTDADIKSVDITAKDGVTMEGHEVSFDRIASSENNIPAGTYLLTFDFYDDDLTLNSIPYIVRVADGITTYYTQKIELNDTYTIDYVESVDGAESAVDETEFVDSVVVKKYSRKMGFSLPNLKREGSIFDGWYTDLADRASSVTEVKKGSTANLKLYAKWYRPELYVSAKGSSENKGYEADMALDSIASAVSKIMSLSSNVGVTDWTILIDGEVEGAQEIEDSLNTSNAKSLTITGVSENNSIAEGYKDVIKYPAIPNSTEVGNNSYSALYIETGVPVTVANIKITGAQDAGMGGGICLASSVCNVILDSGTWVTGNKAGTYGGGVAINGTLTMKDGAVISNNQCEWRGGGVFVGNPSAKFNMEGGTISDNTAREGAAVFVSNTGSLTLSGSAYIPAGDGDSPQDIKLEVYDAGVIVGNLSDSSPETVAAITPARYEDDTSVLDKGEGVTLDSDIISKFTLVQPGNGTQWIINTNGKLVQKTAAGTGNISADNLALNIEISTNILYRNGTIRFSAKDAAGNDVTSGVTYSAQILYKGTDVNSLTYEETPFYSVSGKALSLSSINPLSKEGTYQLYVTASRENAEVTSSQTFDVKFVDAIVTPDTQVALYQHSIPGNSASDFAYYLVDLSDVKTAELDTPVFETSTTKPVFDMYGNFYCLDGDTTLKSNNPIIGNSGVQITELQDVTNHAHNFTIDLANNNAYAWGGEYNTYFYLYKYPSILENGTTSDVQTIKISFSGFSLEVQHVVVYNDILYVVGPDPYDPYPFKIISYDISGVSDGSITSVDNVYNLSDDKIISTYSLTDYISNVIASGSKWNISDVYALEGALYLLIHEYSYTEESQVWNSAEKSIYNRGAVVKYVAPANGQTEYANYCGLKETLAFANTDIPKLQLYSGGPLYSAASYSSPVLTIDGSENVSASSTRTFNYYFPNVYAVSAKLDEKYLSSPAKVIAVKPKKLVIADDGIAFYSDSDGLAYKNINRVVTIDLEEFVIESVQTTKANFSSNVTDYLRSGNDVSIGIIASANGSYYSDDVLGYYFNGSSSKFESQPINNLGTVVFAIKNGDGE